MLWVKICYTYFVSGTNRKWVGWNVRTGKYTNELNNPVFVDNCYTNHLPKHLLTFPVITQHRSWWLCTGAGRHGCNKTCCLSPVQCHHFRFTLYTSKFKCVWSQDWSWCSMELRKRSGEYHSTLNIKSAFETYFYYSLALLELGSFQRQGILQVCRLWWNHKTRQRIATGHRKSG